MYIVRDFFKKNKETNKKTTKKEKLILSHADLTWVFMQFVKIGIPNVHNA